MRYPALEASAALESILYYLIFTKPSVTEWMSLGEPIWGTRKQIDARNHTILTATVCNADPSTLPDQEYSVTPKSSCKR